MGSATSSEKGAEPIQPPLYLEQELLLQIEKRTGAVFKSQTMPKYHQNMQKIPAETLSTEDNPLPPALVFGSKSDDNNAPLTANTDVQEMAVDQTEFLNTPTDIQLRKSSSDEVLSTTVRLMEIDEPVSRTNSDPIVEEGSEKQFHQRSRTSIFKGRMQHVSTNETQTTSLPDISSTKSGQKISIAERRSKANTAMKLKGPRPDGKALSLHMNYANRHESIPIPVARPPRLDTKTLRKIASQRTPEFSPLSANSTNKGTALMELSGILCKASYLPSWFSPWIQIQNRNKLRTHYYRIFHTLKEIENVRLFENVNDYSARDAGGTNQQLNRYQDVVPFDKTRIRLSTPSSDYINASMITSPNQSKKYIASQGPLTSTIGDFWQMVWEQSTAVVVMLTREEEKRQQKCARYWPLHIGERKRYFKKTDTNVLCFKVFFADEIEIMDSTGVIRELVVKRELLLTDDLDFEPEIRRIRLIQYFGWADKEACDPRALLVFIDICNGINADSVEDAVVHSTKPFVLGPMVVHCSAGIGRTGAFCVIDTVLDMLKKSENIYPAHERLPNGDLIAHMVEHFRTQRAGMVQSVAQFQLCYDAILLRIGDWFKAGKAATWQVFDSGGLKIDLDGWEKSADAPKRFSWSIVQKN